MCNALQSSSPATYVLSAEKLAFFPKPGPSGDELSPILKETPHFGVAQGKRRLDQSVKSSDIHSAM